MNLFDFTNGGMEITTKKIENVRKPKKMRINRGFKRIKNKSYETRTYDYHDKKEALNIICEVLAFNGWSIYGYKEDRSEAMTDYYEPASWDGIAVKNGYILVMNNSYSGGTLAGNYVLRSYSRDANEIIKKLIDKNQKLLSLAENEAASEGEKTNAFAMIEKNNHKIQSYRNEYYLDEDSNNPYPANLPAVTYQKNPGRATWHIEKDGKIIDKGTGYFKFCDIEDMRYFIRPSKLHFKKKSNNDYEITNNYTKKQWKEYYKKILEKQDKNEGKVDDLMNFIQLLESKVRIVLGDGENEQLVKVVKEVKEIYYTSEATIEKTDYITVAKGWSKVSGLSSGNIYKFEDNKVYKLTRKMYSNNGKYISSYKPNPNKSTKSMSLFSLEDKLLENKLTYVKLVENYITYEKEEWVKPTKAKATANKKPEDENDSKSEIDYEEILNRGVIKTDTNKKSISYKYVSITEILGLDVFKGLCSYLKSNKLGFYIKGKGFYLNSLNEVAA